jgi:hypothetical protein
MRDSPVSDVTGWVAVGRGRFAAGTAEGVRAGTGKKARLS